jgi:hypothetical protein
LTAALQGVHPVSLDFVADPAELAVAVVQGEVLVEAAQHHLEVLLLLASLRTNIGGGSGWEHLSRRNKRQSIWFPDHEAVMERFYFHLRQGDQLLPDDGGVHLPDFAAGQPEALAAARELFAEAIKSGKTRFPDAFVIADEAGRALDIIPLAAVPPRAIEAVRPP